MSFHRRLLQSLNQTGIWNISQINQLFGMDFMQKSLRKITFAVLSLFVAACANTMAQQGVNTPQEVAREFWSAMVSKDITKAKTFTKASTRDIVDAGEGPEIEKINLQPSKKEHGQVLVPTVMSNIKDGQEQTLSFNTVLVQEIGEWKIDFEKTAESMRAAVSKGVKAGKKPISEDSVK